MNLVSVIHKNCFPGSSVSIVTGYGLDGTGIDSRWRRDFPHLSKPTLGPTQPPVQWVPGFFQGVKGSRGVTLTLHPLPVPLVMKEQSYTSATSMGRTACTEPQCLCKGAPYLHFTFLNTKITYGSHRKHIAYSVFNTLNPELNPICYLLALLGAHNFLHLSRIRVKLLTFRLLMSHIYGAPILDVSRSHTTMQHSR